MPTWYSDLRKAVNATFSDDTILSAAQCLMVTQLTLNHMLHEMPGVSANDQQSKANMRAIIGWIDKSRIEADSAGQ